MITPQAINAEFFRYFGRNANQAEMNYWSKKQPNELMNAVRKDPRVVAREKQRTGQGAPNTPNVGNTPNTGISDEYQQIIDLLKNQYGQQPEFTPFDDTGLYDPEEAKRLAEEEFNPYYKKLTGEYQKEVDTQKGRLGEDLQTLLQQLMQQRGYAKEDLTDTLGDINTQRGYTQTDLAQQLRQQLGGLGSDYENRGLMKSGGYGAAQSFAGKENQQTLQRAMAGYGRQTEAANQGYGRQIAGYGDTEKSGRLSYGRSIYDIGEQQKKYLTDLEQQRKTALQDYQNKQYQDAWQRYLEQNKQGAYTQGGAGAAGVGIGTQPKSKYRTRIGLGAPSIY